MVGLLQRVLEVPDHKPTDKEGEVVKLGNVEADACVTRNVHNIHGGGRVLNTPAYSIIGETVYPYVKLTIHSP